MLVVNASDETLTNVSFTRILPESDDFTVTNTDGCDRGTFAPGDFCTLRYAATPGIVSEDLNDEGGLILGSQQFTYFLASSSLNPFGVAPLALDFGTLPMGSAVDRVARVTNTSPVQVVRPAVVPNDLPQESPFRIGGAAGKSVLNPGDGYVIDIRFEPQVVGVASATVGLILFGQTTTVTLTGCGVVDGQTCPTAEPTSTSGGNSGGSNPGGGGGPLGGATESGSPTATVTATGAASPSPRQSGSVSATGPGVLVGEDRPTSGLPGALVALGVVLLVLALVAGLLIRRGLWILGWRARAGAVAAPSASSTSATTPEPTRELRNGDD